VLQRSRLDDVDGVDADARTDVARRRGVRFRRPGALCVRERPSAESVVESIIDVATIHADEPLAGPKRHQSVGHRRSDGAEGNPELLDELA
jgi:hypothetical protein